MPPAFGAEPLARLQDVGDAELEARLYQILGESKASANDPIAIRRDLRTAQDRAARFLRARGYYAAELRGEMDDTGQPVLRITTGPRFGLEGISVETGFQDANIIARNAIERPADNALTAEWVLNAEAAAQAALENAGWPEAEALPRDVIIDHARQVGNVHLRFRTGPYTRYGNIRLQDEGWRPAFINRLATFETGAPASLDGLNEFEGRLEGLASVREARITLGDAEENDNNRFINVALIPAPRHAIEAMISLSTTEGAGLGSSWSRRNIFGGDETFRLSGGLATLVQSIHAELSLPYWRRIDQRLVLETGFKSEDTDAFQQNELSAGFSLYRKLNESIDLQLGAIAETSRVTDASGERHFNAMRLTSALAFDQRDNRLDPRSGVQAALIINPGYNFGAADATYVQTEVRASAYYPVSSHFTAAARIRLGTIVGATVTDIAADQRFYAGGGGSARGFEYQTLSPIGPDGAPAGGLSVTELNVEVRWRGEGRWGAVAFADTAFADASETPGFDNLRTGIGLGLRYYFDFAPVRFDLATPLDRRPGEDPVHVYISIGQAF